MKIGILTLHSQINYGGVLQAYALQKHLRDNGYDAEVIDYWLTPMNTHLLGFWLSASKPLWYRAIRFPYWCMRDGFVLSEIIRRLRTIRFIRRDIALSQKVYKTSNELHALSGYDVIIVGSDQVWNDKNIEKPNPFLLNWLSRSNSDGHPVRKVAYAASFGMKEIPGERKKEYVKGLYDFTALSVREEEGREIVDNLLFGEAQDTVGEVVCALDPTLLLSREKWEELVSQAQMKNRSTQPSVFCYWLGDIEKVVPILKRLVTEGKKIYFISNWDGGSWERAKRNFKVRMFLSFTSGIRCCFAAGPKEFVKLVSDSSAILSDSFHAMLFGSVFEKPMCIVHKSSKTRENMGARFWDFQKEYGLDGVVREFLPTEENVFFTPNYDTMKDKLTPAREKSAKFLKDALSESP